MGNNAQKDQCQAVQSSIVVYKIGFLRTTMDQILLVEAIICRRVLAPLTLQDPGRAYDLERLPQRGPGGETEALALHLQRWGEGLAASARPPLRAANQRRAQERRHESLRVASSG